MVVLALLVVDRIPELRGYAPWPPEWQWKHLPGKNLGAIPGMLLTGVAIAAAGWGMDRWRARRGLLFVGLLALMPLWQISAIWLRGPDLGLYVAQRTTVPFLEDFLQAAQGLESPGLAFVDYDLLATEQNKLRVATHPPGMIWTYAVFLQWGESLGRMGLGDGAIRFFGREQFASELNRAGFIALALATAVKLLGGWFMALGVFLMARALSPGGVYTGRIAALAALVPATALFTASIDQLAAGLSALSIGLLLTSCTLGGAKGFLRDAAAPLGGLVLFLQSMIVFQFTVTAFVGIVTLLLIVYTQKDESLRTEFARRVLLYLLVPFMLWQVVKWSSGYDLIQAVREGTAAHREGAIHANRSRGPWLFFNLWDVFFFLGLAWIPFWFRSRTWCPWRMNPLLMALVVAWVVMAALDAVRGETARVLLFLFPLLAVALTHRNEDLLEQTDYTAASGLLIAHTVVFAAVLNLY